MTFAATVALTLDLLVPASAGGSERPITAAPAVLAVYAEDWGLASAGAPGLIVAVWGDGQAVWSENQVDGGPPFYAGQASTGRVTSLLEHLVKDGLFADKRLAQSNFGPDSRFTSLLIRTAGKELHMQSWHEWAEAEGRAIATSSGIQSLDGHPRLSVLKTQPADYLYYRAVWGELRSAIQGLLPARNHPVAGEAIMLRGIVSWREKP